VAPIPSSYEGIVKKIYYGDDEICPVGHSLMDIEIEGDGGSVSSEPAASSSSEPAAAAS
jgi:pyruvate/2-oxoglutarate dehydrogenase complex dihydrolipoamide acyltransferase (E2) component